MENTNKLYKILLKGMRIVTTTSCPVHGEAYVIAKNTDDAYQKVLKYLQDHDIGFSGERVMDTITLIADENIYNGGKKLYL